MVQTKGIHKIETLTTAKGNDYLKVTWDDDKFDNIFDPDMMKLAEQAYNTNAQVKITKTQNGKYWNITGLEIIEQQNPPAPTEKPIPKPEVKPETSKPKFAKENTPDKNKAFALSYAKDLATNKVIGSEDILNWAEKFLNWLNN